MSTPRCGGTESRSHHIKTAVVLGLLAAALLLPPSVSQLRNPPPQPLVVRWWLRFGVCLSLIAVSAGNLTGRNPVSGLQRGFRMAAIAVGIFVAAMLLLWPLEFPVLFHFPEAVSRWWSR